MFSNVLLFFVFVVAYLLQYSNFEQPQPVPGQLGGRVRVNADGMKSTGPGTFCQTEVQLNGRAWLAADS